MYPLQGTFFIIPPFPLFLFLFSRYIYHHCYLDQEGGQRHELWVGQVLRLPRRVEFILELPQSFKAVKLLTVFVYKVGDQSFYLLGVAFLEKCCIFKILFYTVKSGLHIGTPKEFNCFKPTFPIQVQVLFDSYGEILRSEPFQVFFNSHFVLAP